MKKFYLFLFLLLTQLGWGQNQTLVSGTQPDQLFGVTVAQLPTAHWPNRIRFVTDGLTASDCTVGGGSTVAVCRDNGTTWASVGGGGGGGTSVTTKGDLQGFSTVAARIPVGSDNTCLIADASQALGVRWGSCAAAGAGLGANTFTSTQTINPGTDVPTISARVKATGTADVIQLFQNDGSTSAFKVSSLGIASAVTFNATSGFTVGGSAFNFTNLAGSLACAQHPALTGDATTSAGNCGVTVVKLNGTTLSALGTGLLKNTTGTGVPSIAVAADIPVIPLATGVSGTLAAAQFPALTGDATTSAGSLATTLASVATPGTNLKVTYDAKGRVTSGTTAAVADLSDGTTVATKSGVQNQSYSYLADSGAADAYVITLSPAVTSYVAGQRFSFKASAANTTTTPTLNVNALGTKTITKQGTGALAAGDIAIGCIVDVTYNGTQMQLTSPPCQAAGGSGTVTVVGAGALTSTAMVTGGGSQALQTPSATSTLDSSGNAVFAGTVTTGSGGIITGGTVGTWTATEGTAPAGSAGKDIMYSDATAHRFMMKNNNGSAVNVLASGADINTSDQVTATHLAAALPILQGGTGQTTLAGADIALRASVQNQGYTYLADSGAADAYVITLSPAVGAYAAGQHFAFKATNANATTTPTLNVNALGAKTIMKNGTAALAANDIKAGQVVEVNYDGTQFQMASQLGNAGSGAVSSVFTRTGAVVATSGDYTLDQIGNLAGTKTFANANLPLVLNNAQTTDSQAGVAIGETSAATNGTLTNALANQAELKVSTATASTASPLSIVQGSVSGTVAFPALQIQTTWNNASLTGNGLLFNVTDTLSAAASLLIDLRKGNTSQFNVDKSGNLKALTSLQTTASAPGITAGTAGAIGLTEGTAFTNVASTAGFYADSTAHELFAKTNGDSNAGMLMRVQPLPVSLTAQTAAKSISTLCAASAGECNIAGQYNIHWNFWGSGTACSSVTAGSVTFLLTWVDENAVTHSAVAMVMLSQTGAATSAMQSTFPFQTALANESASGDVTISTNGSVIQYATGYTACTTGTGTYNLRASVTRVQ